VTSSGKYKALFSINPSSLLGKYEINLEYAGKQIDSVSFNVLSKSIPSWIKDNAKSWSSSAITDSEFIGGIEYLSEEGLIIVSPIENSSIHEQKIPDWIKNNAKWWADDLISDQDYVKSIQYLVTKGIIRI